jgi:hypothetical protein
MNLIGFQLRNDGRAGPVPETQSPFGTRATIREAAEATRQRRLPLCPSCALGAWVRRPSSLVVRPLAGGREE